MTAWTGFAATRPAQLPAGMRLCSVVVDAEEDFDWNSPVQGTGSSTTNMRNALVLQEILDGWGAVPTYLLTWPVLQDAEVVGILRHQLERGQCAAGLQLHPWVTPPFSDRPSRQSSFMGNLHGDLEAQKLMALRRCFQERFAFDPVVYRAGRYGLSQHTGALLEELGFTVDTSIAPRTSFLAEGGPDYTAQDCRPFWFGHRRALLELPLCRSVVGWAGRWSPLLYRACTRLHGGDPWLLSLLARSRCAERITLSPEGNDIAAMRRLANSLCARSEGVLTLSFHSSSLQEGRNPYVRCKADLHLFYDRLSAILDHLVSGLGFRLVAAAALAEILQPAPAPPGRP